MPDVHQLLVLVTTSALKVTCIQWSVELAYVGTQPFDGSYMQNSLFF